MSEEKNSSQKIKTPFLKIEKNCLEIEGTCIQMSNISILSTMDVTLPDKNKLLIFVVMFFAGLAFVPIGLLLSALGGFLAYRWYQEYLSAKEAKCLTIATNSGHFYPIVFKDRAFMEKVMALMIQIMRDPAGASAYFDLKNAHIDHCTIGDNGVTITENPFPTPQIYQDQEIRG